MISAIIPAYNEEKNIADVIKQVKKVKEITEVIVVDDGSTDKTSEIAIKEGVKVISYDENIGKTRAVLLGVEKAKSDIILLIDADLKNLTSKHIKDLIKKYKEGYDMVLMDKGAQPWILREVIKSIPAMTGTRILNKKYFQKIKFKERDRFRFEVRINNYFLKNNLRIAVTPASKVYDPRKYEKYSFLPGLCLDVKCALEVITTGGVFCIFKNLRSFRRVIKLSEK